VIARRAGLLVTAAVAVTVATPRRAPAQEQNRLVASAIEAYQNLDYESAAALLRRALAVEAPSPDTVPAALRTKALTYLAASDFYRGHRDSAEAEFRRLIRQDPRFRPDPLLFPPEVTTVFEGQRRVTKVVAVEPPQDTTLRVGREQYPIRLIASSFHEVVVALERTDGRFLRGLYAGPIGDSLLVNWDGLDSAGAPPGDGPLTLTVTSRPTPGGEVVRVVRVPIDVRATHADTLPWPGLPDTALLPEHATTGPALRSLSGGVLGALAVVVLPSVLASGTHGSDGRFVVAGALTVSGIAGYLSRRPGTPLPDNVAHNVARRALWQRQIETTKQDNVRRRTAVLERIRAGTPLVISREAQ